MLLRAVAVSDNRLKLAAVGGTQSNVRSLVHSAELAHASPLGNPQANRNVRFGPLAAAEGGALRDRTWNDRALMPRPI